MKTFMIRQDNGDLLLNLIEIKSDRCIIDWSFVLGHREPYNGVGVLGSGHATPLAEQRTTHKPDTNQKLRAHAMIN